MKTVIVLALFFIFAKVKTTDPIFLSTEGGWAPQCPAKTTMVRKDPLPECVWGKHVMPRKPTLDQFKCVDAKKVTKLPLCDTNY